MGRGSDNVRRVTPLSRRGRLRQVKWRDRAPHSPRCTLNSGFGLGREPVRKRCGVLKAEADVDRWKAPRIFFVDTPQ